MSKILFSINAFLGCEGSTSPPRPLYLSPISHSGDRSFDCHQTMAPSPVTGHALVNHRRFLVWSVLGQCSTLPQAALLCPASHGLPSLSPWRMAPTSLPLAYLCLIYDAILRTTSLLNCSVTLSSRAAYRPSPRLGAIGKGRNSKKTL